MKCTIPGANMKVLGRAIQALARIGDELYVEPDVNSISFRSVNSSRSAYASFTFNRSFFAFYKHEPSQTLSNSQEDSSKCKISMKSCLPVFRSPVMLDRKVENCIMRLEDDGSKLVFEMRFRHGIAKTYFLPVIECETLQVVYTKDDASNCLLAQVQLFTDTVHNFHNNQEEVTLSVTSQKTSIRSYADGSLNPSKTKSTEILLDPVEFDKYTITSETAITFCLKEFRALLAFAEATGQSIEACFDTGGKPVVFGVKYENTYEASFVLSTLSPEIDSTPQRIRAHNSNTPTVVSSVGTGAKEPSAPSNLRQNNTHSLRKNLSPNTNKILQEQTPELRPCTPREIERMSVRKGESPSLLSAVRSERSLNTIVGNRPEQTRGEKRLLDTTTRNASGHHQEDNPNNVRVASNESRQKSTHHISNRMPSSTNTVNQGRTSRDHSSVHQDFDTPPIMMSNASSISLQLRESDNEDNDTIPSSPQPPRKRPRLFDIFEATFDPANIPGHDIIIAGDSGDEQS